MATYTPERWQIHNELNDLGLLLDLSRIDGERNPTYKQRLMDVFVHRAGADRLGLIYGITRELGLSLYHAMTITPVLDTDGDPVGDNPAVVFEGTKCYVYSDYTLGTSGLETTLDRYDHDGAFNYTQLLTQIQATGYFAVSVKSGVDANTRSMTIFDQSSVELIPSESLSTSGAVINLKHANLFPDSISITSPNMRERVTAQRDLAYAGQYYIDYVKGIIYTTESPAGGSLIRYRYRNDNFKVWASPVILHNLQSDDFKTKMFEQLTDDEGNTVHGAPTELGADILNELLSIHGEVYGE